MSCWLGVCVCGCVDVGLFAPSVLCACATVCVGEGSTLRGTYWDMGTTVSTCHTYSLFLPAHSHTSITTTTQ